MHGKIWDFLLLQQLSSAGEQNWPLDVCPPTDPSEWGIPAVLFILNTIFFSFFTSGLLLSHSHLLIAHFHHALLNLLGISWAFWNIYWPINWLLDHLINVYSLISIDSLLSWYLLHSRVLKLYLQNQHPELQAPTTIWFSDPLNSLDILAIIY